MHAPARSRATLSLPSLALLASLALAALPAAVVAQDGPETPVLEFMAALEEKRLEDAATLFCPQYALAPEDMDLGAALTGGLPEGIDPQFVLDAVVIDFTGLGGEGEPSVTVTAEEGDGSVSLQLDAEVHIGIDGASAAGLIRALVEGMLAAEGTEATDDLVDSMVEMLGQQAAEMFQFSETLSGPVTVTPADAGGWLICSAILDMGESPVATATGVPTATGAPMATGAPDASGDAG